MKYQRLPYETGIPGDCTVTVKEMGNITEVTYNKNRNRFPQVIKLSKENYLVTKTGEIKEYEQKEKTSRMQSIDSMRKTMRRIKELVQTNITDPTKVRWCTLTYANNMQNTKQLYDDFRKFNQKFQRYIKSTYGYKAEYIMVAEPQGRGAWHSHVLYIFPQRAPYISNRFFQELWGHGFTKITKVDNIENIAMYLVAYLSDMEIPSDAEDYFDEDDVKRVSSSGENKAILKGKRLSMYPSGMNIVRHSKGVKYPKSYRLPYEELPNVVGNKKLKYHTAYRLYNDQDYETVIIKDEYV